MLCICQSVVQGFVCRAEGGGRILKKGKLVLLLWMGIDSFMLLTRQEAATVLLNGKAEHPFTPRSASVLNVQ